MAVVNKFPNVTSTADALELRDELKMIVTSIEIDMVNGYYPSRKDLQDLIDIADYAIECIMFDYDI
jgi:hypothetical protein